MPSDLLQDLATYREVQDSVVSSYFLVWLESDTKQRKRLPFTPQFREAEQTPYRFIDKAGEEIAATEPSESELLSVIWVRGVEELAQIERLARKAVNGRETGRQISTRTT